MSFLEAELEDRKEEARRKDAIVMTMAQRIPELEPAPEPREEPETASEKAGRGDATPAAGEAALVVVSVLLRTVA